MDEIRRGVFVDRRGMWSAQIPLGVRGGAALLTCDSGCIDFGLRGAAARGTLSRRE